MTCITTAVSVLWGCGGRRDDGRKWWWCGGCRGWVRCRPLAAPSYFTTWTSQVVRRGWGNPPPPATVPCTLVARHAMLWRGLLTLQPATRILLMPPAPPLPPAPNPQAFDRGAIEDALMDVTVGMPALRCGAEGAAPGQNPFGRYRTVPSRTFPCRIISVSHRCPRLQAVEQEVCRLSATRGKRSNA